MAILAAKVSGWRRSRVTKAQGPQGEPGVGLTEAGIVTLLADPQSSLRVALDALYSGGSNPQNPPQLAEVTITTTGATFSPVITLASGSSAEVTWTWSGGSATGTSPVINFGSAATRTVTMIVADGATDAIADVETFNIGYDHTQDAGNYMPSASHDHAVQAVTALGGMNTMTGLVNFLASVPTLVGSLDFSGMSNLEFIELYHSGVTAVNLTGCSSLIRLDVESSQLSTLNLNPVHATLRDLRAAYQRSGAGIAFTALTGGNVMSQLYHYCVRDQVVTGHLTLAQMPALEELWNWNTGQSGALALGGHTHIRELRSYDNSYTSLTGVAGATNLQWVELRENNFNQAAVNGIIADINSLGTSGGRRLDITDTTGPSSAASSAITALQGRGWTVLTDAIDDGLPVILYKNNFDDDRADWTAIQTDGWIALGGGNAVTTPTANQSGGSMHKTSSGSYQIMLHDAGGSLPTDYEVEVVVPESSFASFQFIIAKQDPASGRGVRFEMPNHVAQPHIGDAYDFNQNNIDIGSAGALPVGYASAGDHTFILRCQGDTITVIIDGTTVGSTTYSDISPSLASNQYLPNTSFGFGGGSVCDYRSVTVRSV